MRAHPRRSEVLIVGAGPAGLAVTASLYQKGVRDVVVLEKADRVGASWHAHYETLKLHTDKLHSDLPGYRMPGSYPQYPTRAQFLDYLEHYANHTGVEPLFGEQVCNARHRNGLWVVETDNAMYHAPYLVIAAGVNAQSRVPELAGRDGFRGRCLHSSAYKNAEAYKGLRVLVVGFGNSAGEIAQDLYISGARPTLSVRGAVNVLPRDVLGLPLLSFAIPLARTPAPVADRIAAPALRAAVGDVRTAGLQPLPYGPFTQIRKTGRIPLIDVGIMRLLRAGSIPIRPEIDHLFSSGAQFADGLRERFDAVIMATGYEPDLSFLETTCTALSPYSLTHQEGSRDIPPGLYVCGFNVVATGMLREISIEAKHIARSIAARRRS